MTLESGAGCWVEVDGVTRRRLWSPREASKG